MNRKLRKAVMAALGVASAAGFAGQASANNVVTDFGTLDPAGGFSISMICYQGTACTQPTHYLNTPKYAWDGQNNGHFGWQHTSDWYTFSLSAPANLDVKLTAPSNSINPAFTLWGAESRSIGHAYNQAGTTSYFLPAGNTTYIGYANSGPTGWINGAGIRIGSGEGGDVTVVATTPTSAGLAELVLNNLPAGNYLIAAGGSCHNLNCPNSLFTYTFTMTGSPVSNVPVPAAAWLLGSGLAGLGVFGRRQRVKAV